MSPALAGGFLTTVPPGKSGFYFIPHFFSCLIAVASTSRITLTNTDDRGCPCAKGVPYVDRNLVVF